MRIIIIKSSGFCLVCKHHVIDYVGDFFLFGQMKYTIIQVLLIFAYFAYTHSYNTEKVLRWNYMDFRTNWHIDTSQMKR